jgi:glycosyltransferase involved in cell wall biosynthesis
MSSLISEFAKMWSGDVIVVTETSLSRERKELGWQEPSFLPAELIVSVSPDERAWLERKYNSNAVHIFSGFRSNRANFQSFKRLSKTNAALGLISEPGRHDETVKSKVRKLLYMYYAKRWGNRFQFLLVTGNLGVEWFTKAGFPWRKIYPFGYFISDCERTENSTPKKYSESGLAKGCSILFVGQIVPRKGVDILLNALAGVPFDKWNLTIVGCGSHERIYEEMSLSLGLGEKIRWLGALKNEDARRVMSRSDILVLPSRFDGWGAVVNEALSCGTKVVVSDACGSSVLVCDQRMGEVFSSGSSEDLAGALNRLLSGSLSNESRTEIEQWAGRAISPAVAAKYLSQILERDGAGSRPQPPWLQSS